MWKSTGCVQKEEKEQQNRTEQNNRWWTSGARARCRRRWVIWPAAGDRPTMSRCKKAMPLYFFSFMYANTVPTTKIKIHRLVPTIRCTKMYQDRVHVAEKDRRWRRQKRICTGLHRPARQQVAGKRYRHFPCTTTACTARCSTFPRPTGCSSVRCTFVRLACTQDRRTMYLYRNDVPSSSRYFLKITWPTYLLRPGHDVPTFEIDATTMYKKIKNVQKWKMYVVQKRVRAMPCKKTGKTAPPPAWRWENAMYVPPACQPAIKRCLKMYQKFENNDNDLYWTGWQQLTLTRTGMYQQKRRRTPITSTGPTEHVPEQASHNRQQKPEKCHEDVPDWHQLADKRKSQNAKDVRRCTKIWRSPCTVTSPGTTTTTTRMTSTPITSKNRKSEGSGIHKMYKNKMYKDLYKKTTMYLQNATGMYLYHPTRVRGTINLYKICTVTIKDRPAKMAIQRPARAWAKDVPKRSVLTVPARWRWRKAPCTPNVQKIVYKNGRTMYQKIYRYNWYIYYLTHI